MLASGLLLLSGESSRVFPNGEKWVPKDFDPKNTVLLVENFVILTKKGENKVEKANQDLKDYMKEHYPYPYEFVDDVTSANPQYADTLKCPYALVWSAHTTSPDPFPGKGAATPGTSGMSIPTTGISYNFFDRRTNQLMQTHGRANSYAIGNFSAVINTILDVLEKRGYK